MKTSPFLDQLLQSARNMAANAGERARATSERLETRGLGGVKLGTFTQGALTGGVLSLLLGSRSGRRLATYGGLAALGTMAYRAYRQQQRGDATLPTAHVEPATVDRLPPPQAEQHSRGILAALIAAAKADGHISHRERGLIHDEVASLGHDAELQAWLDAELERPLDPVTIASHAQSPELASEMYLASRLVIDEENYMERAYLDELVRQLKLDPELRASLDRQLDGP